jgi:hypothetical protein
MTKTFPPLLQYPFEPFEGILCFVGHSDLPRIDYVAKVVASTGNLIVTVTYMFRYPGGGEVLVASGGVYS